MLRRQRLSSNFSVSPSSLLGVLTSLLLFVSGLGSLGLELNNNYSSDRWLLCLCKVVFINSEKNTQYMKL